MYIINPKGKQPKSRHLNVLKNNLPYQTKSAYYLYTLKDAEAPV